MESVQELPDVEATFEQITASPDLAVLRQLGDTAQQPLGEVQKLDEQETPFGVFQEIDNTPFETTSSSNVLTATTSSPGDTQADRRD